MAYILSDIVKYLKFEETDIDNWIFKLYHKGCALLFLIGSMVSIFSQYFGEPISCDFKGLDVEMATHYCWIHGSSYIPPKYQHHMKCIADMDGIRSSDEAPDTSYYQWVSFMLLIQAGTFVLPHKIWKILEGGLISSFGKDARAAVLLPDETKFEDDGVVMEAVVEKYVTYFKSILHRNNWYFVRFFFCETGNLIVLFLNFGITDFFLNGNFLFYGWKVIQYFQIPFEERPSHQNPFCQTFPTEVSCTVPNVGAGGGRQDSNGLCILSQNIINEKIYLIIWFWMVGLLLISLPWLIFRLCTLFFDHFRFALVMARTGLASEKDLRRSVQKILSKCLLGDWFVLTQIGKNVNTYFFRAFLHELARELQDKPNRRDTSIATLKLPNHMPTIKEV